MLSMTSMVSVRGFWSRWRRTAGFLGLLFATATPVAAAPPTVQPETRSVNPGVYDRAAAEVGLAEWGTAEQCGQVVHVIARYDSGRARLSVGLPPDTNPTAANAWLQGLTTLLGWSDVSLYSNRQPGALYLRIDAPKQVRRAGFGGSRANLDLPLLAEHLRSITNRPAVLAVRFSGAQVLRVSPAPAFRHRGKPDEVLFYRLQPAAGLRPMSVDFGVPTRWLAAMAVGFVVWLLFPVVALFAARAHIQGQERVDPVQRVVLFSRWRRGIFFVPLLSAFGMVLMVRGSFLMYLGMSLTYLIPIAMFLPTLLFSLAARLIGMPLERAAWPDREALPWFRAASKELRLLGLVLTVGLASYLIATFRIGGGARGAAFPMAMVAVPMLFALGVGLWTAAVNVRRKKGAMTSEPDAPAELTAAVRALTQGLEQPITRVQISKARDGLMAGAVVVLGDLAVVGSELTEALDTEQLAAYITASVLAQPRTRADKWIQTGAGWVMGLAALGTVVWALVSFSSANKRGFLPAMLVSQPVFIIGSMVVAHRAQKRVQAADFQVAEGMGEPRRFIETLKKVEELQLSTSGMDPSARNLPMAQRRQRLERKLGLE